MTERAESERAELVALEAELRRATYGKDGPTSPKILGLMVAAADALRRLAAPPDSGAGKSEQPAVLTYTNYRGETSVRSIIPRSVRYGSTEWHPEPQWLLLAHDTEKNADREFALKDFGVPDHGGADAGVEEGWTGRKCPHCKGTGENLSAYIVDDFTRCNHCGGTGDEYGPLSKPAPVAANASAEAITEADIRAHVGDGMVSMQNVIDAANAILATRASAEARLREALIEARRWCDENLGPSRSSLLNKIAHVIDEALSTHPHATFQPDGERREAIARELRTFHRSSCYPEAMDGEVSASVDRIILASGLVQNEAGIRRDEREKCAKICDELGDELMEVAEKSHDEEDFDEYERLECAATEYSRAASAIRSARDGGAET